MWKIEIGNLNIVFSCYSSRLRQLIFWVLGNLCYFRCSKAVVPRYVFRTHSSICDGVFFRLGWWSLAAHYSGKRLNHRCTTRSLPICCQCSLPLPPKNLKVFWCFQGIEKECKKIGENGLNMLLVSLVNLDPL